MKNYDQQKRYNILDRIVFHDSNSESTLHPLASGSALRKHAYSNILRILPPKNENFQIKNSDIFHISAQNINCRYSLEPPRRGEVGFKGVNII